MRIPDNGDEPSLQAHNEKGRVFWTRPFEFCGGLTGIRTQDQRIKSPVLYRLSYQPDRRIKL